MGGTIVDTYGGAVGVLVEAAAIGLRAIGLDRDRKMVLGCRSALRDAQAEDRLAMAETGHLPLRSGSVHGIATDPPYGRAASTRGESIQSLYGRAFREYRDLLASAAHVAIVLPNDAMIDLAAEYLELIETHALRVHRSLVRHFCVFVSS